MTSEEPAGRRSAPDGDPDARDELQQARRLSVLFDEAITLPGGFSVGLDPLLGLLPVVGDLATSAVSVYIVMEAVHLGVPRATVARMLGNVAVDVVVGGVPLVGDVFDAAFKANARNVALLEARMGDPAGASADRRALLAVGAVLALVVAAAAVGVGLTIAWLLDAGLPT